MIEIISPEDSKAIALVKAEQVIRAGGIVALATDTVYGFIADATNEKTIARLFELKHRPQEKAFPLFVRDIAMARWYAYISDAKARFLERVWPGPVTVIFHHKEKLPDILTAERETIALRMPDNPFILDLLKRMDIPLAQSSANISGALPAKNAQEIVMNFENEKQKPDLIIGGDVDTDTPSTVIDLTANHIRMVRTGVVGREELETLMNSLAQEEILIADSKKS